MELPAKKVVVLCGGSNGNHVLLADLGRRADYEIRLVTRQPDKWTQAVVCREQRFTSDALPFDPLPTWWIEYSGGCQRAYGWNECGEALRGAHMVLLVCPVGSHREMLETIAANLPSHPILLGTLYGQGGFDWHAREVFDGHPRSELVTIFAMKHYPFLCKMQEYGKRVTLFGRFPDLRVCVAPALPKCQEPVQLLLQDMFGKRVQVLNDFVSATLGGSNQILHPCICVSHFFDYVPGKTFYPRKRLFYAETDQRAASYMWDLFGREMPAITLAVDKAMQRHGSLYSQVSYEWFSDLGIRFLSRAMPNSLLAAFVGVGLRSNKRITMVQAPMKEATAPDGSKAWIPVTDSRFFTDDIPHGLCVLLGMAEILKVEVPRVLFVIRRAQAIMGKEYVSEIPNARGSYLAGAHWKETSAPQVFGVYTEPDLLKFLKWDRETPAAVAQIPACTRPLQEDRVALPAKL